MTLYATFEQKSVENREAMLKEGGMRYKDADFAILRSSGDKNTELVVEVTENTLRQWKEIDHKRHLVAQYEAWKSGQEPPVNGIPLKEWPNITPAEIARSHILHIRTVEDWASITQEGMDAYGMGAMKIKQRAQAYLEAASGAGKVAEQMGGMQAQIDMLKEQLGQSQKMIADQIGVINALSTTKNNDSHYESENDQPKERLKLPVGRPRKQVTS